MTISEIRPDGQEVYVQSGWLRASQRALDDEASTELRPVHTHTEEDAEPLVAGEWNPVRVELFPVAHAFRAGSRLRVTVDAPGGNRAEWVFDTIADGETVEIAHGVRSAVAHRAPRRRRRRRAAEVPDVHAPRPALPPVPRVIG